jgi:hypothetical protein
MTHLLGTILVMATVLVSSLGGYLYLSGKAVLVGSSYESEHQIRTCGYYHPPQGIESRTSVSTAGHGCELIVSW